MTTGEGEDSSPYTPPSLDKVSRAILRRRKGWRWGKRVIPRQELLDKLECTQELHMLDLKLHELEADIQRIMNSSSHP